MAQPNIEQQYLALCRRILAEGWHGDERTGTGATKVFGAQIRGHMNDGFPLLTTKKVWLKGIIVELLWFIQGRTDVAYLHEHGVHIWDKWIKPDGTIGDGYGAQWRSFGKRVVQHGGKDAVEYAGIDQLKQVVERIKSHPQCRRHIVSAWNPVDIPQMALPPCHCFFQFDVQGDYLNLQMYQRSADMFLGVPFNIASYALLLHVVAQECGLRAGEYIHTFGNAHIYDNHVQQITEQVNRLPRALPVLDIVGMTDMWHLTPEHFRIYGYDPHPAIKGDVAV